jgi:putative restriction endonuclease
MALIALTPSSDWDLPFFKVLANNDTGAASGHQGGIVIPMELRPFFPGLSDATSPWNPTTDQRIDADLFVENRFLASVSTRYQYQTWGGVNFRR